MNKINIFKKVMEKRNRAILNALIALILPTFTIISFKFIINDLLNGNGTINSSNIVPIAICLTIMWLAIFIPINK